MTRGSWARSAARPAAAAREARPVGSFGVAVVRARGVWDGLTGGPDVFVPCGGQGCSCVADGEVVAVPPAVGAWVHRPGCDVAAGVYSTEAASVIVSLALGLWADTARGLVDENGDGGNEGLG